jgi:hypothetical protein
VDEDHSSRSCITCLLDCSAFTYVLILFVLVLYRILESVFRAHLHDFNLEKRVGGRAVLNNVTKRLPLSQEDLARGFSVFRLMWRDDGASYGKRPSGCSLLQTTAT